MKREDLSGQKFGEWTAIEYVGNRKWKCICFCSTPDYPVIKDVSTSTLKSGRSTNCGNKIKHRVTGKKVSNDLTNKTFGQLKVESYLGNSKWLCKCSCGRQAIRLSKNLRNHKNPRCDECLHNYKYDDIKGKVFGDWKAEEYLGQSKWICKCTTCSTERIITSTELKNGNQNSCRHTLEYKCIQA